MRDLVTKIQQILVTKGKTLATAESCTGGILAKELTTFPGSSAMYLGGVSSYSNLAKQVFLKVPTALLETHGAVSAACAEAMALGVKEKLSADYAVSLTGIAGPDGGSEDKPVGTVWCGLASPKSCRSVLLDLSQSSQQNDLRESIRIESAQRALSLLLEEIGEN
jgi:PncC family amidohydrolase